MLCAMPRMEQLKNETSAVKRAPPVGEGGAGAADGVAEEELFLFAFATQAEVLRHVRSETAAEDRGRVAEILDAWQNRQARVLVLVEREAGLPDRMRTEPLPPETQERLARIAAHPLFQKTFQEHPVTFEFVDLDTLVAPQRTVNLAYARGLAAALPTPPTLDDLITLCLEPERAAAPPVQHLEEQPNVHMFSSPSADLRFLNSAARDTAPEDLTLAESGGLPRSTVLSFVGYGCASINAYRVGRRLLLNNGFHRVYALRSRGVRRIPVVVQEINDPHRELPPVVMGMPTSYLIHDRRPVLVKDFFEPGFTVSLRARKRIRAIKVTVSASTYDVLV